MHKADEQTECFLVRHLRLFIIKNAVHVYATHIQQEDSDDEWQALTIAYLGIEPTGTTSK